MPEPLVIINRDNPGVTILSLNRPEKRNALTAELLKAMIEALHATHTLHDQRVIIIRGEGPAFCSGLDLKETIEGRQAEHTGTLIATLLKTIYNSPLVTIAMIHGAAIAGGAGIAAACDISIAAEGTLMGFPEVRRGLVAAIVSTLLLRQLSERNIRELLLIGEPIGADKALRMGLINFIHYEGVLLQEALRLAEQAKKGAPAAIVETKRLLQDLHYSTLADDIDKAIVYHKQSRMHYEAQEGIAAFLENREPRWALE